MVTEYIKREQRMGYDETGTLVYKVPVSEPSPLATYTLDEAVEEEDEDTPPLNLV